MGLLDILGRVGGKILDDYAEGQDRLSQVDVSRLSNRELLDKARGMNIKSFPLAAACREEAKRRLECGKLSRSEYERIMDELRR